VKQKLIRTKHHQINVRTLESEIRFLRSLSRSDDITIGFEITNPVLSAMVDLNIDPQHQEINNDKTKITCVENLIDVLPELEKQLEDKNLWLIFLKTDLDSIAAAAVLEMHLAGDLMLYSQDAQERIKNIANYDRHGRIWSPKDELDEPSDYNKFKIPRGLFMLISGWKNTLGYKIQTMKDWITLGTFDNIDVYNEMAINNFKEALSSSKIDVIIPEKLVFVRSNKRGACGIGYSIAPIVIAMNPSFRFGFGDSRVYGRKWAIAQCDRGFISMSEILRTMLEMEPGWGGSETIIGSPQEVPSKIPREETIEIVKNIVEKTFQPPKSYLNKLDEFTSTITQENEEYQNGKEES
jgi:hypothetical protein